jgi:mycofactocin precursor
VSDTPTDPKPATEAGDEVFIDEIEVEDLAVDGICGVY